MDGETGRVSCQFCNFYFQLAEFNEEPRQVSPFSIEKTVLKQSVAAVSWLAAKLVPFLRERGAAPVFLAVNVVLYLNK